MNRTNANILVVEDELIIQENLVRIINEIGYKNIFKASSFEETIKMLDTQTINLVLLDVNLGKNKKSGLDIANYIKENKLNIPFFFVTANSDYATLEKAKSYSPLGYIVKPFSKEVVLANLEIHFNSKIKDSIEIRDKGKTLKIDLAKVLFVKSDGVYVEIQMLNGNKYLKRTSLKKLSDEYLTNNFIQIHKSYIINKKFIKSQTHQSVKIDDFEIPVGRTYRDFI